MPGTIPGVLGVAAFAGIKFAGYSLALSALKKFEPSIAAGAMKIAALRTGVGFILGPLATILGAYLSEKFLVHSGSSSFNGSAIYAVLFVARIFIWALVLYLFTRQAPLPQSRLWLYSLLGAVVSSLLDWPGYALAINAPGKIAFC